uniref:Uncharacterized protein n=1 Tax=Bosea sp. NBC_00436 TaxID=2969620 RepID=A0A9E8CTI5_9HYPH
MISKFVSKWWVFMPPLAGVFGFMIVTPAASETYTITREQCVSIRAAMLQLTDTVLLAFRFDDELAKFQSGMNTSPGADFLRMMPKSDASKSWNAEIVAKGVRALKEACKIPH